MTGFFLALFTLFFFLKDGAAIWGWVVRLFPRGARERAHTSGLIAWGQLSAFTRATILVAAVDAIGIGGGAAILGVPFASGIALLVFFGAFIPVIGATISGTVAVMLALVALGPVQALIMLGIVIGVQQLEAHLLQPLLIGRAMKIHPLAVIFAIAAGLVLAGIIGALIAVPTVAVLNAVVAPPAGLPDHRAGRLRGPGHGGGRARTGRGGPGGGSRRRGGDPCRAGVALPDAGRGLLSARGLVDAELAAQAPATRRSANAVEPSRSAGWPAGVTSAGTGSRRSAFAFIV